MCYNLVARIKKHANLAVSLPNYLKKFEDKEWTTMERKWKTTDKIIIWGGLLLAVTFVAAGTLLYFGITSNFIRLN